MSERPLSERNIKVFTPVPTETENAKLNHKTRVAAYCRVSTDSKEQETSYNSQVIYYTNMIKENPDWEMVGIYADPAITGTSRKHRVQFNKMLYDCLKGKIDLIVTKSMSRFARNQVDTLAVIRMLNGFHPPVGILFEESNIRSLDLSSDMLITILSLLAEQESVQKSKNVKWGFERRKEQGHYLVPTHFLLGYDKTLAFNKDDREIYIVEDEAKIVKIIFMMFLAGFRVSEIAYTLTTAHVPTGKGNFTWNDSSVLGILKNERYAGDVRTNKTYRENLWQKKVLKNDGIKPYIYETDHHPAIIDHESFEMAQKLIASHKYGYDTYVNGLYALSVIDEGLLQGFIPINIHWAGSDLKEYIEIAGTVEQTRDIIKKVEKIPCFPGFQIARIQDIAHGGRASIHLTPSEISLNSGALNIFDTDYIEILFNPIEKLIAFRASEKDMPGAVHWRRERNGKLEVVSIGCAAFTKIVYELMNWPKLWNTNLIAKTYRKNNETVMIFDLTQPEISALQYEKPKKHKVTSDSDALYNVEAMIAQQLELMFAKQDKTVELTSNENPQLPPPKREKKHLQEWMNTFGQKSEEAAISCRQYQFTTLKQWNISAEAKTVDCFKPHTTATKTEIDKHITELKTIFAKDKESHIEP